MKSEDINMKNLTAKESKEHNYRIIIKHNINN